MSCEALPQLRQLELWFSKLPLLEAVDGLAQADGGAGWLRQGVGFTWCMTRGAWHVVHGMWCLACGAWLAVWLVGWSVCLIVCLLVPAREVYRGFLTIIKHWQGPGTSI